MAGKRAFGFSDRSGRRYLLTDMVYEVRNGQRTGMRVGRDEVDPDHPQLFVGRIRTDDPKPLRDPRPDTALAISRGFFGWRPVGHPALGLVVGLGNVTVSTE